MQVSNQNEQIQISFFKLARLSSCWSLLYLLVCAYPSVAQIDTVVPATFVGGEEELYEFIGKHLRVPIRAKENNISGYVKVMFVIDSAGRVKSPKIMLGLGYGCDEAVLDLISAMPDWNSATQAGRPVNSAQVLPIRISTVDYTQTSDSNKEERIKQAQLWFSQLTHKELDSMRNMHEKARMDVYTTYYPDAKSEELIKKEKFKEALQRLKELYRGQPLNHHYHLQMGLAKNGLGKPESACMSFMKAKELGSTEVDKYILETCN